MTLIVEEDPAGLWQQVVTDLQTVCPDPNMRVNLWFDPKTNTRGTGHVLFAVKPNPKDPNMPIGCGLISSLISTDVEIHIYGERTSFKFRDENNQPKTLWDVAGITTPVWVKDGKRYALIVYDVTNCDLGAGSSGYSVLDDKNNEIPFPRDVILFHELVHAFHKAEGTEATTKEAKEIQTIQGENQYRAKRNLPLRNTTSTFHHVGFGKCKAAQKVDPPRGGSGGGGSHCFIATAAYGSAIEDQVEFLRRFRDHVLMATRSGESFFHHFYGQYYYRFSPPIADQMRADPKMADSVRFALVEPIVHYLRIFLDMPDASLEGVPEPWQSFLVRLRDDFERWTSYIDLPESFDGLDPQMAARELGIFLRYALRTPEHRQAYLDMLEQRGSLPLPVSDNQLPTVRSELEALYHSPDETEQILGRELQKQNPAKLEHAMGNNVGASSGFGPDSPDIDDLDPQDWLYTVTISNLTYVFMEEIALFYKRKNLAGLVLLIHEQVAPGNTVVFTLGRCSQMECYAWGARYKVAVDGELKDDWVSVGNTGPHDRDQAEIQLTGHAEPCADSYRIEP